MAAAAPGREGETREGGQGRGDRGRGRGKAQTRARPPTRGLRSHPPTRPTWPPKPEPACRAAAAAAAAAAASPTSPVPAQPPAPAGHFRSHTHFRSLPGRAAPRRHFRFDPSRTRTRTQGRRGGWAGACATPPIIPGPRPPPPRLGLRCPPVCPAPPSRSSRRSSSSLRVLSGQGRGSTPNMEIELMTLRSIVACSTDQANQMRKLRLSGEFICPRSQN
ncbi:sterile alpha motif domain-containing protein 1-like [Canis lupus dingo]|uniref:sterile alpha motif domain-containing protein 1-like n=1 Tax=Canis lupus dingo TaxID=286419 RepID=UPI0020C5855E|nr:sterile alpha motif domain-containing protein 1-like [Canis lupus dingo]